MLRRHSKRTVLVVDYEPDIANTFAEILRDAGYIGIAVTNPAKAVQLCSTVSPDLAIVDLDAPAALDATAKIITILPHCKLLLRSSFPTPDLVEEAKSRGLNFEFVPKPLPPEELLSEIERVLTLETLGNEPKLGAQRSKPNHRSPLKAV
jgi:DNA-binding NtrC family response regulator